MPPKLLSTALSLVLVILVSYSCADCIPAQELAEKTFGSQLFSQPANNVSSRLLALPFHGAVLSDNQASAQRSVQAIEPTNQAESSKNKNSSSARHLMEVRDSRLLVD